MPQIKKQQKKRMEWDPGEANPKQKLFYEADTMFVGYGGAKGGGQRRAWRPTTAPATC